MVQSLYPFKNLAVPRFSGSPKTQPAQPVQQASLVGFSQVAFGADSSEDKLNTEKPPKKPTVVDTTILGRLLLLKEESKIKATQKKEAETKYQKKQQQFIQELIEYAQVPKNVSISSMEDLIEAPQLKGLAQKKINRLKNYLTQGVKDYSGLLLKGNQPGNRFLIKEICHAENIPLLTQKSSFSLSESTHSKDHLPILESMLSAAKQVAKEQGRCVVYLDNMDAIEQSKMSKTGPNAFELSGVGETFTRNKLLDYFKGQSSGKPTNVIIIFDQDYPFAKKEEQMTRKGRLKPLHFATEAEERYLKRFQILERVAKRYKNVQFDENYLKKLAAKNITEDKAKQQLTHAIQEARQTRTEELNQKIKKLNEEIKTITRIEKEKPIAIKS